MTKTRNRTKRTIPLTGRLAAFAEGLRSKVEVLPPGPARDELVKKLHSAKTAETIEEWAQSPGFQPPR